MTTFRRLAIGLTLTTLAGMLAPRASSQAPTSDDRPWAGSAECQISIQAPGYSHRETHLWAITGGPTRNGNMQIYPATWTVAGDGSLQRVTGPTTVSGQWRVNGTVRLVEIGVTRHLNRITIQRWTGHGPARSGLTGVEITTVNGTGRSRAIALDVQQWSFPLVEDVTTSTRMTG